MTKPHRSKRATSRSATIRRRKALRRLNNRRGTPSRAEDQWGAKPGRAGTVIMQLRQGRRQLTQMRRQTGSRHAWRRSPA